MPVAALPAIIGGIGAIGGAAISSNAAGNAADEQSKAAEQAAQLQYQASQNALDFQKQQYGTSQAELQPYLQSGAGAISNLDYLLGIAPQGTAQSSEAPSGMTASYVGGAGTTPVSSAARSSAAPGGLSVPGSTGSVTGAPLPNGLGVAGKPPQTSPAASPATFTASPSSASPGGYGSLLQPYGQTFTAPTALTEQNDPGYQARLNLGQQALQQSAAARGNLLTGGTAQALNQNAQDYASNEYNNVYNRALSTFGTNYNQYENQQNNEFNRLAAISGVGQTAANTLGNIGQNASSNVSNNLLNTASNMGQDYQTAANANATGLYNQANAINGGIGGALGNLSNFQLLQQLKGYGNASQTLSNQSNPYYNGANSLDPTISNYTGY